MKTINRWKIAFWICFIFLLLTVVGGFYSILDQGVALTHLRESHQETEDDLKTIIELINETDLTKEKVKAHLQNHRLQDFMEFENGSVSLERIQLSFVRDRLDKIKNGVKSLLPTLYKNNAYTCLNRKSVLACNA